MRCWDCGNLLVVSERSVPTETKLFSQTYVADVLCGRCGATYSVTTHKGPTRAKIAKADDRESTR